MNSNGELEIGTEDEEISTLLNHTTSSLIGRSDLKRRKLRLKEEIERLRRETELRVEGVKAQFCKNAGTSVEQIEHFYASGFAVCEVIPASFFAAEEDSANMTSMLSVFES